MAHENCTADTILVACFQQSKYITRTWPTFLDTVERNGSKIWTSYRVLNPHFSKIG
jgi:hypothetical protein